MEGKKVKLYQYMVIKFRKEQGDINFILFGKRQKEIYREKPIMGNSTKRAKQLLNGKVMEWNKKFIYNI